MAERDRPLLDARDEAFEKRIAGVGPNVHVVALWICVDDQQCIRTVADRQRERQVAEPRPPPLTETFALPTDRAAFFFIVAGFSAM